MIHEDFHSLLYEIEDEIGDELEYEEARQLIDACVVVIQTIQSQGGEVIRRDFLPMMRRIELNLANGDTISITLTYQDGLSMIEVKREE